MARKRKSVQQVELADVKKELREKIKESFGSVAAFLASDKGQELGGAKIRSYLYRTGSINYELLSSLTEYFGIGKIERKIIVQKSVEYFLTRVVTE